MNTLEKIALEKLEKHVTNINNRIYENEGTPTREVQHILPFMKSDIKTIYEIINALKDN